LVGIGRKNSAKVRTAPTSSNQLRHLGGGGGTGADGLSVGGADRADPVRCIRATDPVTDGVIVITFPNVNGAGDPPS
jgi:hypothetical protein